VTEPLAQTLSPSMVAAAPKRSIVPMVGVGVGVAAVMGLVMFIAWPKAGAQPQPPPIADVKPADPKVAEVKPADPKVAEVKPVDPKVAEVKSADPKVAEVKPADPKVAEAKPADPKVAEVKPADPKAADTVMLSVTTTPDHAQVYDGDKLLGATPGKFTVSARKALALRIELKGYRTASRTLTLEKDDELSVPLEKAAARPPQPPNIKRPPPTSGDGLKEMPD
jgi:hypothetical protein